ncbi:MULTISPECIES: MoaD/ThiS family protein [Flavobacterium]|uniref:ThiS family protein n=2 Tax=Flavobacterium TaxID=237 RepID=A0A2N9PCK9_9FLAO|nr:MULTISPECIES: MoaD/ThiS family protein [Flavobacterium]QYS88980.1 MoaD/ThiS family protein [Flavobacterium davisii]RVU90199.1 MoaD/ThiS family protein [Flavobacterium columnare]SPE78080.1 ThiS family protein [Flavobacterium columnare]
MQIKIKYFGQLMDITHLKEEIILINKDQISCTEIIQMISFKYKGLEDISFEIAVNKQIQKLDYIVNQEDEIALLPPFAGG